MWSVRVARIADIPIEIHLTFLPVLAFGAWQGWVTTGGPSGALVGVLAVVLLFGAVLIHEFGHALQAQAFDLPVKRVVLLIVGGAAELEATPSYAWQEMLIALAGPIINALLALVLALVAFLLEPGAFLLADPWLFAPITAAEVVRFWLFVHVVLFVFNMLPAFPMDGGRVLRSALAIFTDYERATTWAAWVGRGFAVAIAAYALLSLDSLWVTFAALAAALLVFGGATAEAIMVRRRRAMLFTQAKDVTDLHADALQPWDELTPGLRQRMIKYEHPFPVMVEGRLVGVVAYGDLNPAAETIAHAMRTDFPTLAPDDTLWAAFREMQAAQLSALPVLQGEAFLGMLTLDHIERANRYRRSA